MQILRFCAFISIILQPRTQKLSARYPIHDRNSIYANPAAPIYWRSDTFISFVSCLQILVKALMQMPATDFMLCMYLVPGAVKEQKIEVLKQLSDKLETCQFKEYWADMADEKNASVANGIPGFHEAIRQYIVGVISVNTFGLL